MSKVKFAAARELIQEKHYDAARAVLQTVDDPTAHQWLQKLDRIAPPFPQATAPLTKDQERFYRGQNRDRRRHRIGNGINLIGMAIGAFALFAIFVYSGNTSNDGSINIGLEICLLPLGLVALAGGLRFISKD